MGECEAEIRQHHAEEMPLTLWCWYEMIFATKKCVNLPLSLQFRLVYRECVYIFGGISESQPLSDLYEYNFGMFFLLLQCFISCKQ